MLETLINIGNGNIGLILASIGVLLLISGLYSDIIKTKLWLSSVLAFFVSAFILMVFLPDTNHIEALKVSSPSHPDVIEYKSAIQKYDIEIINKLNKEWALQPSYLEKLSLWKVVGLFPEDHNINRLYKVAFEHKVISRNDYKEIVDTILSSNITNREKIVAILSDTHVDS